MEEIITNELIQYKSGFCAGKNEIVELIRLGKIIDFNNMVNDESTQWYDFGYRDAIEYFSNMIEKNIDITTIRVRDVIKELFSKRVIMYNQENKKEVPISTFKINK